MQPVAMFCATILLANQPKTDAELIRGAWRAVSLQITGTAPKAVPDGLHLVITADTLSVRLGQDDKLTTKYKLRLDATKEPKEMDLTQIDPSKPKKVLLAIYAIDGDELKLCFHPGGNPRPKKLENSVGTATSLWLLKRAKHTR